MNNKKQISSLHTIAIAPFFACVEDVLEMERIGIRFPTTLTDDNVVAIMGNVKLPPTLEALTALGKHTDLSDSTSCFFLLLEVIEKYGELPKFKFINNKHGILVENIQNEGVRYRNARFNWEKSQEEYLKELKEFGFKLVDIMKEAAGIEEDSEQEDTRLEATADQLRSIGFDPEDIDEPYW